MAAGSGILVLILNAPPYMGIHRVQLRLAERLEASWERIDPFCHLDDYRNAFPEDVANGFEDGIAAVEGVLERQGNLVLEWRLAEQTYQRLVDVFRGNGCRFALATVAPPLLAAMASGDGREPAANKRLQIRRFYERRCHRHTEGLVMTELDADPDNDAVTIIERLKGLRLLP